MGQMTRAIALCLHISLSLPLFIGIGCKAIIEKCRVRKITSWTTLEQRLSPNLSWHIPDSKGLSVEWKYLEAPQPFSGNDSDLYSVASHVLSVHLITVLEQKISIYHVRSTARLRCIHCPSYLTGDECNPLYLRYDGKLIGNVPDDLETSWAAMHLFQMLLR